jgi:LSD1 subclass zinc finger protein
MMKTTYGKDLLTMITRSPAVLGPAPARARAASGTTDWEWMRCDGCKRPVARLIKLVQGIVEIRCRSCHAITTISRP